MKARLFGKVGHVNWEWQRSFASSGGLVVLDIRAQTLCGDFISLEGIARIVGAITCMFTETFEKQS